jgi:ubiquinol-cytochrome c reductase cytochrome b subunit
MPPWETHLFGFTISWNIMIPGLVLMGLLFGILGAYPFIERWITGDNREHHLLDRPRNQPTRTAFGVAGITAYGLLWVAGGNDIVAAKFGISLNAVTWFMRIAIFVGPVIAYIIAKRWALSLQRHDKNLLLHGYETGVIVRSPSGGYSEVHSPVQSNRAYTLTTHERPVLHELPEGEDANGVRAPRVAAHRIRAKLSNLWFSDDVPKPTVAEIEEAHHHPSADHLELDDGHHVGIETRGWVSGDEFDLDASKRQ